jgi:hypothetical protein
MVQAQEVALAALEQKNYLDAFRIICERRDMKTNKVNVVSFKPVTREQVMEAKAAAGKGTSPDIDESVTSSKSKRGNVVLLIPLYAFLFLAIIWGGYFLMEYLQHSFFGAARLQN